MKPKNHLSFVIFHLSYIVFFFLLSCSSPTENNKVTFSPIKNISGQAGTVTLADTSDYFPKEDSGSPLCFDRRNRFFVQACGNCPPGGRMPAADTALLRI